MDSQTIINVLIGLVAFFGGIWVKSISDSLKEMKLTDTMLADKVQSIELLVAGQYVRRDDMEKHISAIFTKLDRIESKLDGKVDK